MLLFGFKPPKNKPCIGNIIGERIYLKWLSDNQVVCYNENKRAFVIKFGANGELWETSFDLDSSFPTPVAPDYAPDRNLFLVNPDNTVLGYTCSSCGYLERGMLFIDWRRRGIIELWNQLQHTAEGRWIDHR